ncbi:unnamed protein product [Candida verbasci]|uniref:Rrp1p n=1 Tax=Candida verbasci TaxID=1227364 RepID=A0A9W4TYN0_9ASCO|nr:unnamed protein product [Candida verbasci]
MSSSSTTSKFVKKLASNDKKTRDSAIANLKLYLGSKNNSSKLSLFEFEKLWKGLYYSVWFCDRVKTQTKLCENLASIYSTTLLDNQDAFLKLFKSFNLIIIKEWPSIDQWRIDKFYMLIRRILRHNFKHLKAKEWDNKLIEQWLSVLNETLLSGDSKVPLALPYHLCDIYLDELELVIFEDIIKNKEQEEITDEEVLEIVNEVPVLKLISSFKELNKSAKLKTLREKCKEDVLDDKRLINWKVIENSNESEEDVDGDNEANYDDDSEDEWKGFN